MTRAPGPKGSVIWGSLPGFSADSLGFLADAVRDHGDIVRFRFGPVTAHLVNHPDHIDHVLSRNSANYDKATRSASRIAATTGDSLLSANHEAWARHRRLIQPAFQPWCFDQIGTVIDTLLDPMLDDWAHNSTVDIVGDMMSTVIGAAIRILFSSDIDARRIDTPLRVILADTWRRIQAPLDAGLLSPRLHRPAFRAAVAQINAIVHDLIAARRATAPHPDDVLTHLLAAHDDAGDAPLTDTELRDATLTLLLAGHETTANALSWAFIHAAGRFEGDEPAHIFSESLRLYPSIWVIERRAIAGDVIGGFDIPRGSSVMISPYLLHRHKDFWPDPDRFDPQRFAQSQPRTRDAYVPFGHGAHRCVGLHLAQGMARHIIARVFDRFTLQVVPGQSPCAVPGLTLHHSGPVHLRVSKRRAD